MFSFIGSLEVMVLAGSQARLACDLGSDAGKAPVGVDNEPSLIEWLRAEDKSSAPSGGRRALYTVERDFKRGVALVQADHRVAPSWRDRLHFSVSRATLSLAHATLADDGIYVCQVRFPVAPERTSTVRLVVVGE